MTSRITYRYIYRYAVCYYRYRDNNVIIAIIKLSILLHSPSIYSPVVDLGGLGAVAPLLAISGHTKGWMCCYKTH